MEIPRGDNNFRFAGGDRKPVITITARGLDRGLDRLRAGVHRQARIEPGETRELLAKRPEIIRMIGTGDDIQAVELTFHGVDETRMQMTETRRRIGAHHIDIALAAGIEEMRASATRQDNRKRRVIFRAKAGFASDDALRGYGGWQGHGALQGHGGLLSTLPSDKIYRTEDGALAPELGPFSRRISATKPLPRAKMRGHLFCPRPNAGYRSKTSKI